MSNDISPVKITHIGGNEGNHLTENDVKNIYYLTYLHYYSADLPRIKFPITVRYGRKAARLAQSGLTTFDFPIRYLY